MNKINFIKSNKIVFVVLVYGYFSLLFFLDLRISVMFFCHGILWVCSFISS